MHRCYIYIDLNTVYNNMAVCAAALRTHTVYTILYCTVTFSRSSILPMPRTALNALLAVQQAKEEEKQPTRGRRKLRPGEKEEEVGSQKYGRLSPLNHTAVCLDVNTRRWNTEPLVIDLKKQSIKITPSRVSCLGAPR